MKKLVSRSLKLLLVVIVVSSTFYFNSSQAAKKSRFEKLELFNKVLFLIESQYYRNVDTEKLIQGAISGMMNTLDPHSVFLDQKIMEKMSEDTRGEFGGLGIEVTQKDGVILIITPIEDSPAHKAGIQPGDKIVEINHESILGMSLEKSVDKMKGKANTKITLGIVRQGVEGVKQYTITREVIKTLAVKPKVVSDNYAYVRLTQFSKNAGDQVAQAIKDLKKKISKNKNNVKGIILDLRYNPGGLLDEAVEVSSVFLNDGIVVSTEGRDPKNKEIRYVKKTGFKDLKTPVVVLINGASASASEIVAGALQDNQRAILMGSQSFGKGSVQTIAKIDDLTGVKLTIAQYMTPSGKKIQAIGIKPDIEVPEVAGEWVDEHMKESEFVREKDLRNHLTATIETPEEKKLREEDEKQDRIRRIELLKKKNAKKEEEVKSYAPETDFLVMQAVKFLDSFQTIRNIKGI